MEINVEDNFLLLFDKNNNMAYKALQVLQKECEKSDKVYCYKEDIVSALQKADISIYADSMQSLVYKDIQKSLAEIQ